MDLGHTIRKLAPRRRSSHHRYRHPLDHPPHQTKTSCRTVVIHPQPNIHTQVQVDLKWILDSPPLFDGADGLLSLIDSETCGLPKVPPIETWDPSPASHRVGLYFESLVDLCLTQGFKLKMEARHRQVFDGKRTLGEIDFCVLDQRGIRWHLESTIKFYLHHPSTLSTHGSAFIGPDPRDSFERKYGHLMQRQLRQSIPEFTPVNHALPVSRGILFYHVTASNHTDRPAGANPGHLRGLWMRASDWHKHQPSGIDQVVHLPKPYWLSGFMNPEITGKALTWKEAGIHIQSHFEQSKAPLMLSLKNAENGPNTEAHRCIIVHDSWPEG